MKTRQIPNIVLAILALALLANCATSKQAAYSSKVKKSGFLGDYSNLEPGKDDEEAMLRWHNPNADWSKYERVMIPPVTVWGDQENKQDKQEDLQRLAGKLYASFVNGFSKRYKVVNEPASDVVLLSAAITDANANNPVMKGISTIVPISIGISAATEAVTDKPSFAGDITGELLVKDSVTGEVLAKSIDRRVGGRSLSTVTDSWSAANDAIEAWSAIAVYRFCILRGDNNCPKPE